MCIDVEGGWLSGNKRGQILNREAVRVSSGGGDMGWVSLFLAKFFPEPDEGFSKFVAARVVSTNAPEVVTWGVLDEFSVPGSEKQRV
jgi:hypothetical protein